MPSTTSERESASDSGQFQTTPSPARLASLDAYRGFVMVLMAAELLHLPQIARSFPDSAFWQFIASQTTHREWVGCSLHDLIQPSFTFLAGVSLPFSIASRSARGERFSSMFGHSLWRSFLLIVLGIFLRSVGHSRTNFTFEDTLTQIGLGYWLAFLVVFAAPLRQWLFLGIVLIGYWAVFALHPLPEQDFNWQSVGVPPNWPHHLSGFAQHWDKNSNFAAAFEVWFLNLFPREKPFLYNGGGYVTLSFIPTLGTMILGVIAGRFCRTSYSPQRLVERFLTVGTICMIIAAVLHFTGICPIVKRIWTPSWTLFSGGWCFFLLAAFYAVIDWKGAKRWAFPLIVVGMNSIATYVIVHLWDGFIARALKTHLGSGIFQVAGKTFEPLLLGAAVLLVFWLILWWMYRRRLFLKI